MQQTTPRQTVQKKKRKKRKKRSDGQWKKDNVSVHGSQGRSKKKGTRAKAAPTTCQRPSKYFLLGQEDEKFERRK